MYAIKPELAAFIAENMKCRKVMTPITMREGSRNTAKEQELPKVAMAAVLDTVMTQCGAYDVPVRIYVPTTDRPLPVLIYYHGGGFVIDDVPVYDPVCRRVAQATEHIVISPEYRLAPENPYPAAEEDALAVAKEALPTLQRLGVAYVPDVTVCGDSAGGYLAAMTAITLQGDDSVPLTHQIVVYPCLDMTSSFPSIEENCCPATGFLPEKLGWYFTQYFPDSIDRRAVSPLFRTITAEMVPTLVMTTQFCPFRDEGKAYAEKIKALGVPVLWYNYETMVHSYLNFERICYDEICDTYQRMAKFLQTY